MREMPEWLEKKKKFCDGRSSVIFWRKSGPYLIVHEEVSNKPYKASGFTLMRSAYSPEGLYIGSTLNAWRLWNKYGITRFYGNNKIAFVGANDETGVWYGWSHRAIGKFKKGQWKRKAHMPHEGRAYRITNPSKTAFACAEEVS